MRFATVTILASAAVAAAQSTTAASTGGEKCAAQNILDQCKFTLQQQIDKCDGNDWICLCDGYTNLLTCYNNCPDSSEKPPVQNQVTQFCNAAAPLKSASLASRATQKSQSPASATATGAQETGTSTDGLAATGFGSGTKSASGPANTGAAGALAVPAGGALAALLGLAGLL